MEKVEIIPCPFCGGEGELQHEGYGFGGVISVLSFVWCKKCGAIGAKFSSDEKAIEAWNSRTNDK